MSTRPTHPVRLALPALTLTLALAAGGCDWRTFDEIQDHTPVLAVGAPSHFGASDFGRIVLPISTLPVGAFGARYVVSSAGSGALAIVDIDATGKATSQNVSSPELLTDPPVTALAEVVGTNQVLLGVPTSAGVGAVSIMTMGAVPTIALFGVPPRGERFGLGVAAGKLAGGDAPDFVVASASGLIIYVDGDRTKAVAMAAPPDTCPMTVGAGLLPRDDLRRALLVAPLTGAPGGAQQIVVGTTSGADQGAVNVFTVDAAGTATCAMTYRNTDPRFGQALATGDFDGDGALDLLVGSPPSHAFWIKGPLKADSPVLPVTLGPGQGELGAAVAAVNVDGKGGDEALIGNPDATVGGDMLAGEVRVVTGAALDTELAPLRRHDPSAADVFGISVGALPFFCKGGCGAAGTDGGATDAGASTPFQNLVLVGSGAHAFTNFKFSTQSPDPRTP